MGSYEVLPIGNKIKNLRKKYSLNQEQLAGKDITRNLISQVENGKANLTKSAAKIMLKNLKKICHNKNIKVNENIDYLMESEVSQASKIVDRYIEELKDLSAYKDGTFEHKLSEAEEFLASWDIRNKKIFIFDIAGDYYCSANDFYNSAIYYEKAKALIDTTTCKENLISILRKLSTVYYYIGKYEEDIKSCDFALNHFTNMSKKYYCIFTFNSALCYFKLKEYNKTLYRCKKIEKAIKKIDTKKYCEVLLQEAICLVELNEYEKSLKILINLADDIDKDDTPNYVTILINLAENYLHMDNMGKTKETLNIINANINNLNQDSKCLSEIYLNLGELYAKLHNTTKAKELYSKALTYAKKFNCDCLIEDILSKLMDIYTSSKDKGEVSKIKDEYFMISSREEKIIVPLERKLIEFYLGTENVQALKELYNLNKKLS